MEELGFLGFKGLRVKKGVEGSGFQGLSPEAKKGFGVKTSLWGECL